MLAIGRALMTRPKLLMMDEPSLGLYPLNPINRRISIIVMNKKAEESARSDGGTVETGVGSQGGNQQPVA